MNVRTFMLRSEFSQYDLHNWWKDQIENPELRVRESDLTCPSSVQPSLSNQEENQIKSRLCFPSDSNQDNAILVADDLNNEEMMVGLNDNTPVTVMMPDAVAVVPSSFVAKRYDAAFVCAEKAAPSNATRAKIKGKESKGFKSRCQVSELGSRGNKKEIVGIQCRSPKKLRPPEVHRVTERKRRDKINEKIKALGELVPRCSKLDKVSTLDKAICHMKNLQMQVRMMSGGYDMGMQMFPGMAQPCMPQMSMFTDVNNVLALLAIHANMNPGRMCPDPSMINVVPALPYQHKPYQSTPVNLPFQHNMASAMFQFPQGGPPSVFPFGSHGNFQI